VILPDEGYGGARASGHRNCGGLASDRLQWGQMWYCVSAWDRLQFADQPSVRNHWMRL